MVAMEGLADVLGKSSLAFRQKIDAEPRRPQKQGGGL